MTTPIEFIDQTGMRALILERLEHPEVYADKPLFIWQASFGDGIQQELFIKTCIELNRCKASDERKYFRLITLREESIGSDSQSKLNEGNPAGYVITTCTLCQDQYLREFEKLIKENNNVLPIIVYLPYRYKPITVDKTCFAAEQRIFTPDFEQWAPTWQDTTIPDFIRGDGDKNGIAYRWYNYYNNADITARKGCDTPGCWLAALSRLHFILRSERLDKLCDIDEGNWNRSFEGISQDLVDEFRKFVKVRQILKI